MWLLGLWACVPDCEPVPEPSLGDPMPWEMALVADDPPQAPDVQTVLAEDGLPLAYRDWLPPGEVQAVVLLVHGSSAHGGLYGHLAKGLAAEGLVVRAVEKKEPGHKIGQPDFEKPERPMSSIGG